MQELDPEKIAAAVRAALQEDLGTGDATTLATVPVDARARAVMRAREPLVVAGLAFAEDAFLSLSRDLRLERKVRDGQRVHQGEAVLAISGPARAILSGERVALNFLQHLSGVATATAAYVHAVAGTSARILDTRKTTPGWRQFEKYAVACGGGHNHRIGLYDLVLIKDNHLAALRDEKPNPVAVAVQRARALYPQLRIEVEADTLEQVRQAVAAGVEIVLLDNMSLAQLREAVAICAGKAKTEASGGVTLSTVRAIAETGVDFISVGALTHSARSVDLALDFES